jgi:hypothetical protein
MQVFPRRPGKFDTLREIEIKQLQFVRICDNLVSWLAPIVRSGFDLLRGLVAQVDHERVARLTASS